jgi:two-component system, chemotaxis family, sensor kinase CheA
MGDSETLMRELLETFRLEAQDHLDALGSLLVELEREESSAQRRPLVEHIFRRMHTLKGAAHAVNLVDVAKRCQDLESLLSDLKRGDLALDLGLFDRLHREVDLLTARIFAPPGGATQANETTAGAAQAGDPGATAPAANTDRYPEGGAAHPPCPPRSAEGAAPVTLRDLADTEGWQAFSAGDRALPLDQTGTAAPDPAPSSAQRELWPEKAQVQDTVRVPTRLLESLLLQAEELVSAKLAASVLLEELSAAAGELVGRGTARSRALELAGAALRTAGSDLPAARLAGQVQELCECERHAEGRLRALEKGAERNLRAPGGMIDPLLEEMRKLHLLPFATLTDPFGKLIRDLARELGKEAEMTLSGGDLEIDRRILAGLKDPLLHLIRNVMDHGIETVAQRTGRGKPVRGKIGISLKLRDAQHAELTVSDDGRGIDPAQVRGTALRLELVTAEAAERMGDAEALQLVFESGFSTAAMITALSGRGIGLAIVREALERLGGHVTVSSRPGQGTEFTLTLPLSFALIRGVQVVTGGRPCMLPAANVELTSRLARDEIRSVEGRDTVVLGGEVFSLVSLAAVLELGDRGRSENDPSQQVVLLRAADKRIAFAVDQVIGVQEVLVKPLGSQLARVRNVAGATVLGNGCVVPILNINDLLRSALLGHSRGGSRSAEVARSRPKRLSVLVAEDSITSRTLLKNILESSGYQVSTAFDGADALSQLKTGSFDIVVSDVEMPRLDGFGLTAAIRADSRWASLPVILVTGLESRAHREHGIEVGANAYVVKSSFDQSSLIEVIQKLT